MKRLVLLAPKVQSARHDRADGIWRPRSRCCYLRPGGAVRIGREGTGVRHFFLWSHVDRPVSDSPLRHSAAEANLFAIIDARRADHGLRPHRARGRQQSAGNDEHLPTRWRTVFAQRSEVSDFQRRHRRHGDRVRLSGRPQWRRPSHQRVYRRHGRGDVRPRRSARQARNADDRHRHVRNDRPSGARGKICLAARGKAFASRWRRLFRAA